MMNLKITVNYPHREVKELVNRAYDFVFEGKKLVPPDTFKIWIKNSEFAYAGRFYSKKISVRIGTPNQYPCSVKYPNRKTAPAYMFNDWQEGLYGLVVHELWHWVQFSTRSPYSEVETERRVVVALEKFRNERAEYDQLVTNWNNRLAEKELTRKTKMAEKNTPEYELQELAKKMAKIQRRLKLYQTKIKKMSRRQRFLQKKILLHTSPDVGGPKWEKPQLLK